jgi:2-keto-4-pentenoate hydratase/2-oxohepta-3-ene-1,7-dioic acid hydratase in catechol pathway
VALLIVRYLDQGVIRWGRLMSQAPSTAAAHIEVGPLRTNATTTASLITAFDAGELGEVEKPVSLKAVALLSPITSDATLVCQGLNYVSHAAEARHHERKQNLFFAKASSSLTGPFSNIERPQDVQLLDYEVEFAVVLRTNLGRGINVHDENLGDYAAGVVLCNDVSARDVMFGASFLQWYQGKSYRTFCPAGPVLYLLEKTETTNVLANLEIKLLVNGEIRQSASSSQLIFKPAETLTQLSRIVDLKVGDLLLTGTPGGVTAPASPKLIEILRTNLMADDVRRDALRVEMAAFRPFLKAGDVVTATLHDRAFHRSLGGLENHVTDGEQ